MVLVFSDNGIYLPGHLYLYSNYTKAVLLGHIELFKIEANPFPKWVGITKCIKQLEVKFVATHHCCSGYIGNYMQVLVPNAVLRASTHYALFGRCLVFSGFRVLLVVY